MALNNVGVSVIVTCFNLEQFLGECLASLRMQTVLPEEIIVVHDGCVEIKHLDSRVTSLVLNKNRGVAAARDAGFKVSTGRKILFLDADDMLPANYLQEMLKCKAQVAYPNWCLWNSWVVGSRPNCWYEAPAKVNFELILKRNEIAVTSLMDRTVYDKVGGFEKFEVFEDWQFWLKCLKAKVTFEKANTFLMYRQRADSRNHQDEELRKRVFEEIKKTFTLKSGKNASLR